MATIMTLADAEKEINTVAGAVGGDCSSVAQGPSRCAHGNHGWYAGVLRFFGWWFAVSGLYALFSVCPFCGQTGCPVGAGGAGLLGGFFALCLQGWRAITRWARKKLRADDD